MTVVCHPSETHPCCPESTDGVSGLVREFLAATAAGDDPDADRWEALLGDHAHTTGSLWQAARWYAERGWPVFRLKPGGKVPLVAQGFHAATTDLAQIDAWWGDCPQGNIGVPTGHAFDVIDVDYHSHPDAMRTWLAIKHEFEVHGMACTPRGMHYFVQPTGAPNTAGVRGVPGLDYRGKGGYVVVPPSRRPDGRYFWWSPPSPDI
jgi:hypothetical protein